MGVLVVKVRRVIVIVIERHVTVRVAVLAYERGLMDVIVVPVVVPMGVLVLFPSVPVPVGVPLRGVQHHRGAEEQCRKGVRRGGSFALDDRRDHRAHDSREP